MTFFARTRAQRLVLWLVLVGTGSLLLYSGSWAALARLTHTPLAPVQELNAAPWAVLLLCLAGLSVAHSRIWAAMQHGPEYRWAALGAACLVLSLLIPPPAALLTGALGLFALLFGSAALIPAVLLVLYLGTLAFPVLVGHFAELPFALSATLPVTSLLALLGYPVSAQGGSVDLTTLAGNPVSLEVTAACAGPATMAVFAALFAVMHLDRPLPAREATTLFLLGLAGTWFQAVVRVLILLLVAWAGGETALERVHHTSVYILFPLWYAAFAYLYLRRWRRHGPRPAATLTRPDRG